MVAFRGPGLAAIPMPFAAILSQSVYLPPELETKNVRRLFRTQRWEQRNQWGVSMRKIGGLHQGAGRGQAREGPATLRRLHAQDILINEKS